MAVFKYNKAENIYECSWCGELIAMENYKIDHGWRHCPFCGMYINNFVEVERSVIFDEKEN